MNAPRHVLMTADAVGGVWTYALDLGQGLAQRGARVSLAVLGPGPDEAQRRQARDAGLQLFELGGALDWTAADEGEIATSAQRVTALAARLRPDLIHLNSPALAAFAPLGAPVLGACHSCVKTWWASVNGAAPLPSDLAWRVGLVARGYAACDALLAPSHAFAQATQAAYDLARAPQVVLNGRSGALCRNGGASGGDDRAPIEEERVLGPAILTAGRLWDSGKDVATLDRAAGRLKEVEIAAAGPTTGPHGEAVILANVRALGRLADAELQSRLAQRCIFVSPSVYEPFGLAVLEAAQAGCPLVLSDIATFRELWDGAAAVFPAGDDEALARLLGELAADPDRRAALGAAARSRAARYTAETMIRATLQLYAALSPAFAHAEVAA